MSTAQVLRTLEKQLEEYRRAIEKLFAEHPDHDLFGSLPGAGAKLAPRLLSEIGSDRGQYPEAQGLQCVAGTAPVSFESGKIRRAKIRWHCNRHLRHAVHLWASHACALSVGRILVGSGDAPLRKPLDDHDQQPAPGRLG